MIEKIKIAVSACLLGQKVRYDAQEKKHALIIEFFLQQQADSLKLVPFCPEVAIGLGVPREKIQLIRKKDKTMLVTGVDNQNLDVSADLQSCAETFLLEHSNISCCIVKSKSPSCGYQSTPVIDERQQILFASGLFIQTLKAIKPELLIIEETQLDSKEACLQLFHQLLHLKIN